MEPIGRSVGCSPYGMACEEFLGEGVQLSDDPFGRLVGPLVAMDACMGPEFEDGSGPSRSVPGLQGCDDGLEEEFVW